jgi:primary-amine oxidase
MAAHLLDPLSPTEYQKTAAVLRRDQDVTESWRFASIELKEPAKIDVKAWHPGDAVARRSFSMLWNTETNQTYEAVVDLIADSVKSWTDIPDVCPNFTIDEYHDVDHALHEHEGVLAALRERGITDPSLVLFDVWTYGKAAAQRAVGANPAGGDPGSSPHPPQSRSRKVRRRSHCRKPT